LTHYSRVLISYPKCGRTWLWYAACKALSWEHGIRLIKADTLKWSKNPLFDAIGLPLASSTHSFFGEREKKVANAEFLGKMTRDPRDIIVSAYYYWKRKWDDLDSYLDHKSDELGRWTYGYANSDITWSFACDYQDLHDNFRPTLVRFLHWLGSGVSDASLDYAEAESRFEIMHAEDPRKARRGTPGDWRNHLTDEQERRIWEHLDKFPCNLWRRYKRGR